MVISTPRKLFIFFLLFPSPIFAQSNSASPVKTQEGFSRPASVILNKAENVLYVSNMAGDKKRDGFISRVSTEGEILEEKWVENLEDPKGLLLLDDKLYVTNNTELVEILIRNGRILRKIKAPGAKSLNAVTADGAGNIYISDSGKSSIYSLGKGENRITEWLISEEFESPNGLLAEDGNIFVASGNGNLLRVNKETKKIEKLTRKGIGKLEGIQSTGNDFYVSDSATGSIFLIGKNGKKEEVLTSEKGVGDILYLKDQKYLILPMKFQDSLWWYKLD